MSTSELSNEPAKPRNRRNRSNLTHGLRAVTLGSTPRGASYVGRLNNEFRSQLEAAVIDAKGEVSLTDACSINTACRWERHAMLATRWLKKEFEQLTPDQRLNFSREVAKASANRDAAIRELKLEQDARSIVDALYGPTTAMDANANEH